MHHCVSTGLSPRAWLWALTSLATGIPPLPSTASCPKSASPLPTLQLTFPCLGAQCFPHQQITPLPCQGREEKVAKNNFELCSQVLFLSQIINSTSYLQWIHLILPRYQVGSNVLHPREKKITLLTSSCSRFKLLTHLQEDF